VVESGRLDDALAADAQARKAQFAQSFLSESPGLTSTPTGEMVPAVSQPQTGGGLGGGYFRPGAYTIPEQQRLVDLGMMDAGSLPQVDALVSPSVASGGDVLATDTVDAETPATTAVRPDNFVRNVQPLPEPEREQMPEDDALTKILTKLTESQQPTGREWIPSAITGATGLLGAYLGSRAQGDAFKREDLRYQQQQDLLNRSRGRREAAENYEAQLSHARELGLDAPRKRMSAAAQQRYAEGMGLKLDPELFKTPDLDPTFTGGSGGYLPPSNQDYMNSELNTARRGGGGIKGTLGTILKYGLPALGVASGLGALGVPHLGWASKLAGGLGGLLGIGGGQKPIPSTPIDPNYGMYSTQTPRAYPRPLAPVARRPRRPEGTWI
tara:strand:- start:24318 stop:25466 length:1149 start_codon:yes stop_codon:yes gene_type:complete